MLDPPRSVELGRGLAHELRDGVVHVRERKQTFRFEGVPSRPVPSLLRGFSAPVKLTIDLADRELEFLMAQDGDQFNRWQAAEEYAIRIMIAGVRAIRQGKRPAKPLAFIKAHAALLGDESLAPAYRAAMRRLVERGAQGIILGCTEISMLVSAQDANVPLFDTTAIHAAAAVELALGEGQEGGAVL